MSETDFLKDLHLIQRRGEEGNAVSQFLAVVIEDLAGFPQDYSGFALPSTAATTHVSALATALRSIYADALSHNVAEAKFIAMLGKLGISSDIVTQVSSALFSQRDYILSSHRKNMTTSSDSSHLVDFDWSVRHVLSSEKLLSNGETLVNLSLKLEGGAGPQCVNLELNAKELDALIATLETAVTAAK